MPSYYEAGTYFCLLSTHDLYKISSVTCQNVEAAIVSPGEAELLHHDYKSLGRNNSDLIQGLIDIMDRNIRQLMLITESFSWIWSVHTFNSLVVRHALQYFAAVVVILVSLPFHLHLI